MRKTPRNNLTRIPLLLGAIATTATAPKFGNTWHICVVGWAIRRKVWPGIGMKYLHSPEYDGDYGIDAVSQYLNISWLEASHAFADGCTHWTRRHRIGRVLKLIGKYLVGKGDTQ